jgi:VanZ family protein
MTSRPLAPPSRGWAARLAQVLRQPGKLLRNAAFAAAVLLVLLVLALGTQPRAVSWVGATLWDKLAHVLLHFVLCWLLVLALGLRRGWLAFCGCVAFAVTDEFFQQFSPGRTVSAADVLASAIGALFALANTHAIAWAGEMRSLARDQAKKKRLAFWLRRPSSRR